MNVGTVLSLHRYPVKSMQGESLTATRVAKGGVVGDRAWALRDETAREIRGGKKLPLLMQCRSRYTSEPSTERVSVAEITLPDGTVVQSDAADVGARLSSLLERKVALCPLEPEAHLQHYERGAPDNPDLLAEWREIFGRTPDEPMPDISGFPPELSTYTSPPGTYFDAFPILVMTTATLAFLAEKNPDAAFDVRRFRPNLLLHTGDLTGLVEAAWVGKTVRIGDVRLRIAMSCPRCSMTIQAQGDLPKDPSILRTIVREADQNIGVYATVEAPGAVCVGDPVHVDD